MNYNDLIELVSIEMRWWWSQTPSTLMLSVLLNWLTLSDGFPRGFWNLM